MSVTVTARIKGISRYSQSRYTGESKKDHETDADFEERIWRKRWHIDDVTGRPFIPPMALKNCLAEAAKYLSIKIKGESRATYTKNFEAGIVVVDKVFFDDGPQIVDDLKAEWLFLNANGKPGTGTRVERCYPFILANWTATVTFHVVDNKITDDVFEQVLRGAGSLIGIGRFRPRNRGYYGRFIVEEIDWQEN